MRAEGRFVLGANSAGQALVFDRATASEEALLIPPVARSLGSESREITDLAWYPKDHGIFALLNGPAGKCSIWDTQAFTEALTVNLRFRSYCFAFGREGNELAVGCKDSIRFVDLKSHTALSTFSCTGEGIVQCVEWSQTKSFEAFYGTNKGFLGKFDLRYLGAAAEKFETQHCPVGITELWAMNRELMMMDAGGRVSLWSFTTGECLEENAVQLDFGACAQNYLQRAVRAHSAVRYNDDGQLVRVGRGFSIWNGVREEILAACSNSTFIAPPSSLSCCALGSNSTVSEAYFNSPLSRPLPSIESNVEFVHPTMECLFPFVEYNHQLDEVYLYREGRIAPIFEWEPHKLDRIEDPE